MKIIKNIFTTSLIILTAMAELFSQMPGSPDLTFNGNGRLSTFIDPVHKSSIISDMLIQSDGKIILIGSNYNGEKYEFLLIRFLTSGDLDITFNSSGRVLTKFATGDAISYGAALDPDGKITVVGSTNGGDLSTNYFGIARYFPNGAPDNVFSSDGQLNSIVGDGNDGATSVAIQEDLKILVAGLAQDQSGFNSSFALARYFPTGAFDRSFGDNGKVIETVENYNGSASSILVQKDGKIVVGGTLTNESFDTSFFTLLRYNTDGTLDPSFGNNGMVITSFGKSLAGIVDLAIKPDGKIIALGTTTDTSLVTSFMTLVRYNEDGSVDTDFGRDGISNISVGSSSTFANSMVIQPDGKILAAGTAEYDTLYDFALARINENGGIDRTFSGDGVTNSNFEGYLDFGEAVDLQKDGKIMVGGYSLSPDQKISNVSLARFISGLIIGTDNHSDEMDVFEITPNISSSNASIIFNVLEPQVISFNLLDEQGRILEPIASSKFYGSGQWQIPLSGISSNPNGVYLIQMTGKNFRVAKPFIKM